MYKLSVIIPVYNVENYLRECLDSITNQTVKDIEIICIDDGSSDNSPDILKEYQKKDSRIKIITKENGGQASARNLGIKEAQGEYIAFIDSDDFIEAEMLEKLYTKAKDDNLDIAMCKIATYNNQTKEIKDNVWYYMLGIFRDFEKDIFNHKDTKEFTCNIAVTPYNKIYKTSLIKDNGILFPEGLIFEDEKFFYDTYLRAKRVSIIPEFLYYYRVNRKGSTVDIEKENDYTDIIEISKQIRQTFKETNNYEDYKYLLNNRLIHLQLARFTETSPKYREKFFNLIKEDLQEVLKDPDIKDNLESDVKIRVDKILKSKDYEEFKRLDENKIFSVVMASYNCGQYLDETINSLIGQSFSFGSNIQLIIVDDGSTDNTKEICLKYQSQYPDNIIYLYQENQGQGVARNLGLKYANGKYITKRYEMNDGSLWSRTTDNFWQDHNILSFAWDINNYWSTTASARYTYGYGYYDQFRYNYKLAKFGLKYTDADGNAVKRSDFVRKKGLEQNTYGLVWNTSYKRNRWDIVGGVAMQYFSGNHFGYITYIADKDIAATFLKNGRFVFPRLKTSEPAYPYGT